MQRGLSSAEVISCELVGKRLIQIPLQSFTNQALVCEEIEYFWQKHDCVRIFDLSGLYTMVMGTWGN